MRAATGLAAGSLRAASDRLDRARAMVTCEALGDQWRVVLHGSRPGGPTMTVHQGPDEDRARRQAARLVLNAHTVLGIVEAER